MLIKNTCKNMKILKKNKNMIRGIHYFSTELKTKIDVITRGCFKYNCNSVETSDTSVAKDAWVEFFISPHTS